MHHVTVMMEMVDINSLSYKEAPAITWKALTKADHGKDDEEEKEEHAPYNNKTFKRAATKGMNSSNKKLDSIMPRWEMNKKEVDAVIEYLKKLD